MPSLLTIERERERGEEEERERAYVSNFAKKFSYQRVKGFTDNLANDIAFA